MANWPRRDLARPAGEDHQRHADHGEHDQLDGEARLGGADDEREGQGERSCRRRRGRCGPSGPRAALRSSVGMGRMSLTDCQVDTPVLKARPLRALLGEQGDEDDDEQDGRHEAGPAGLEGDGVGGHRHEHAATAGPAGGRRTWPSTAAMRPNSRTMRLMDPPRGRPMSGMRRNTATADSTEAITHTMVRHALHRDAEEAGPVGVLGRRPHGDAEVGEA